jgi:hypothetical protein
LARKQSGDVHYVESGVKLLKTRENQRLSFAPQAATLTDLSKSTPTLQR